MARDERGRSRLTILSAASGSPASRRATEAAARLAADHGGELIVVHVRPPTQLRVLRLGLTIVEIGWLADPFLGPVLLDARRVAWAHGILARVGLISVLPAEGVLMAASELSPTLIVIGTRRSRLSARLAAPTRARIQRRSPVPVLTVPSATLARPGCTSARVSSPTPEVGGC